MPYKLLLPTLLLLLAGFAGAQTTSLTKADEDAAKLEKAAVEFLRETAGEVSRLRTMENRISFNAELASLMWFHDDKEAKAMYGGLVADFKQLLTSYDMQMNAASPDDEDIGFGLFGGFGKKPERKLRIAMQVRQQIAMSLAEHAPDLAYNFFLDSFNLITNETFRKETEKSDKTFEMQLINRIAETNAAKALEFGKDSIKSGLDNNHLELLKKIYTKDADKGVEFGASILSRLKSDGNKVSANFYSGLLTFGAGNLESSKKSGGKKAVYSQNDLRDIAEQFAQLLLESKSDDMEYGSDSYIEQIEKYAPARAVQLRARSKKSAKEMRISAMTKIGNADSDGDPMPPPPMAKPQSKSAADIAREDREKAEEQVMKDVQTLGKELPKEQRDKIIAQARKIISETRGKEKKITAISLLGAQVARLGDKELADEIMRDADRLVNPQPKHMMDFMLSLMLASGYAEANPDKAFPLLESTILRANETIGAAVKVAEFIDISEDMIDNGEIQVGMFGGEMIRGLTQGIGVAGTTVNSLVKADFTKTKSLTNTFDRIELRVLAKMLVLRTVLDKRTSNVPKNTDPENVLMTGGSDLLE